MWQDVRHACRSLARQPSCAAAVIAIVALGSSAATSVFVLLALAAWVPARRAMRVDPLVALRFE